MKTSRRIDEIIMFVRLADYLSPQVFSMVFRENENINSSQLCHGKNLYSENNVCKEVVNYQEKIIADIACDHGYIGIGIYEKGLANKVIFSDISKKSLEKAQKLIQNRNDFANFKFIVGNGLEVLSQQIFLSVIAGIGGREIVKILSLSDKVKLSKFLILQTRQDDDYLRMNLAKLGLVVYADKMVIMYTIRFLLEVKKF